MARPTLTLALCAAVLACAHTHAATVQVTVLGKDGQPLTDAVVRLLPTQGRAPAAPPVQAKIEQQKMRFLPAVTVVPPGSRVTFSNLDNWEHHVRGTAAGVLSFNSPEPGFELRLAGRTDGKPATSAEVLLPTTGPVLLGCHLHGSMRGHIYVADSPWAQATGPDGVAAMSDVPEGHYQLRVWHGDQLLEPPAQPLEVKPVTSVTLPTQVVPRRRRL